MSALHLIAPSPPPCEGCFISVNGYHRWRTNNSITWHCDECGASASYIGGMVR